MRLTKLGMVLCLITMGACASAQLASNTVFRQTFESGVEGWAAAGLSSKVDVTHSSGNVKTGNGALEFDYVISKGTSSGIVLQTPDGALAKMRSLHFWIKCDHSTPIIVLLKEKDGGYYRTIFTVPSEKWQEVQLAPSDFYLGIEKDDPKDPDGKLDLDQVSSITISDFSQTYVSADSTAPKIFSVQEGPHKIFLDDFIVSTEELPDVSFSSTAGLPLDPQNRPQMIWTSIGDVELGLSNVKPIAAPSLKATYRQGTSALTGFTRRLIPGKLSGMDLMEMTIASVNPIKLVVQIEDTNGGKYSKTIQVPGGSEARAYTVPFSGFRPNSDSHGTGNRPDLAHVDRIIFLDASGALDIANAQNTLWIGKLRATQL